MLSKKQHITKRSFDLIFSIIGIIFLIIPIIILIILASLSCKTSGLFLQKRIGKNGNLFNIYKIKTMINSNNENTITIKSDKRITKFGKFLRKYHLDELPQIINVLNGTMSFVGPRPDVKGYADKLSGDDKIILTVKPGITGPATLKFKNEEELLLNQKNPKTYNDEVLWKQKITINKNYIKNWSLANDIKYIIKTIL